MMNSTNITSQVLTDTKLDLAKILELNDTYSSGISSGIFLVPEYIGGGTTLNKQQQFILNGKWWSIKVSKPQGMSDDDGDGPNSISSFYSRANTETQYDIVISIEEQD